MHFIHELNCIFIYFFLVHPVYPLALDSYLVDTLLWRGVSNLPGNLETPCGMDLQITHVDAAMWNGLFLSMLDLFACHHCHVIVLYIVMSSCAVWEFGGEFR